MKFKCYFQVALNKLYTNYNYCTITIVNLQSINLAELIKSWVKCIGWWQGPLADVKHTTVPKTTKIMGFKGFFGGGGLLLFQFCWYIFGRNNWEWFLEKNISFFSDLNKTQLFTQKESSGLCMISAWRE